eukprot:TRINITY_DN12696_c0_g1_i1.p1 TRINITY_DN12696_c0_g1~~TRINITY_DN12696_c0_g1_i1.p1  ORF type:complete len:515 (-),score=105.51 TRINITY_DN12696_c0_g1_i1:8-1552(-)
MITAAVVFASSLLLYYLYRAKKNSDWEKKCAAGNIPTVVVQFLGDARNPFHALVPKSLVRFNSNWHFEFKYKLFEENNSNVVGVINGGYLVVNVADPEAVEEICRRRDDFTKPLWMYKFVELFGPNVISTEGAVYNMHRKIVSPPFSEKNNKLVAQSSVKQTKGAIAQWESNVAEKSNINTEAFSRKITLHVLAESSFGFDFDWIPKNDQVPAGHKISFQQAIPAMVDKMLLAMVIPKQAYGLPIKVIKDTGLSVIEFESYVRESIEREAKLLDQGEPRTNLLSAMISKNRGELTDDEIVGNAFLFLVAGTDTSSGTITYILYHLAIYQEEQEKWYQEVKQVVGDRELTYEDYPKLATYPLCFVYEVLRMFPPIVGVPKTCSADQPILGGKYVIPAGADIVMDCCGTHYSTEVWGPDAASFNPSRFDNRANDPTVPVYYKKGSFYPFSEGVRMCLGKKFAQVELIFIVSTLLQKYKVQLPDDFSVARAKKILDESVFSITLRPQSNIPIKLTQR